MQLRTSCPVEGFGEDLSNFPSIRAADDLAPGPTSPERTRLLGLLLFSRSYGSMTFDSSGFAQPCARHAHGHSNADRHQKISVKNLLGCAELTIHGGYQKFSITCHVFHKLYHQFGTQASKTAPLGLLAALTVEPSSWQPLPERFRLELPGVGAPKVGLVGKECASALPGVLKLVK